MIEICKLKDMADLHQAGKLPFRIVQEVACVLLGLCDYDGNVGEAHTVTRQQIDWMLALPTAPEFMHYLGGHVFLCEAVDDLAQITGMETAFAAQHGRWPNITESILAWDDCRLLRNADGSADHALLFAATNNAGGPSWFIPRSLWQAARIDAQISAHQQYWRSAR